MKLLKDSLELRKDTFRNCTYKKARAAWCLPGSCLPALCPALTLCNTAPEKVAAVVGPLGEATFVPHEPTLTKGTADMEAMDCDQTLPIIEVPVPNKYDRLDKEAEPEHQKCH